MDPANHGASSHQAVDTSVVWLVSFGDLLTLLFCFFLVLTPHIGDSLGNQSTKEGVSRGEDSANQPGTRLATLDPEMQGVSFASTSVMVAKANSLSSEERRKRARAAFTTVRAQAASETSSVRVRVCEGNLSKDNLFDLFVEARSVYEGRPTPEFEYGTPCDRGAHNVPADAELIAVIESSRL